MPGAAAQHVELCRSIIVIRVAGQDHKGDRGAHRNSPAENLWATEAISAVVSWEITLPSDDRHTVSAAATAPATTPGSGFGAAISLATALACESRKLTTDVLTRGIAWEASSTIRSKTCAASVSRSGGGCCAQRSLVSSSACRLCS